MKSKKDIKENDIEFMTDSSAAMMQGVPIVYHVILWSAAAFLFIAVIWANFAVLDVVTTGQGKVIPSTNIQTVQNLEGGIVKDIRVKIGEIVERDQILMVIDDTRFSSSLKEGEVQIHALEAKISRLTAEASGEALAFAEKLEKEFPHYVQNEKSLYDSRKRELEVKLNILTEQEGQIKQELLELKGKSEQLQRSLTLVEKELTLTKPLARDGAVSEVEILRLERTVNDLAGELEQIQLSIPRVESTLVGAQRKIDELLITFRTETISELNTTKAEYRRLLETQRAAEDRFSRTVVRTPVRGTVNQIYINTIGGIIQPGEDLFDIVPLNDTLLIEAKIRPADIGFLRPDLESTVKISAYDFSIYGGLSANVEHISADTITDEKGDPYYTIRVRTTDKNFLIGKHGERLDIIPGMSATVDILTGHKTVLEYLLKPIIKAKQNAMRER
tara:strand:+ start:75734 stop:77071 length:1338 start_codon:yes stop_codon:yes gene_type:complete